MDFLRPLQRRIGHFPIELPAALLLAGAVAFVTMAMPDWRFESLVTATGLPGIVGAAQPPLGQTARVIAALAGAGLSFFAVWLGLRALDRRVAPTDFPAFRAADLHPDAPRRRPISAGAEFGTPVDAPPPAELARKRKIGAEVLPSFLAPEQQDTDIDSSSARADRIQAAPVAEVEHAPEPVVEPAPIAAPESEPLLRRKPVISVAAVKPDAPFVSDRPMASSNEARDGLPSMLQVPAKPVETVDPFWEELPSRPTILSPKGVAPQRPMAAVHKRQDDDQDDGKDDDRPEESVGSMMARLESGLTRRGSNPLAAGPAGAARDELRATLSELNKSSGRNG